MHAQTSWCLLAALVAGSAAAAPPRLAPPQILTREIDGLIRLLRAHARPDGRLGDGSCLATAQVLAAAGHCHRFYHAGDGPWIRNALRSLFTARRADGSFADGAFAEGPAKGTAQDAAKGSAGADPGGDAVLTTRWVAAALEVLDPGGYAEDLVAARAYLQAVDAPVESPIAEQVAALAEAAAGEEDRSAAAMAAAAPALARMPRGYPAHEDGQPDLGQAAALLAQLVACQVFARGDPPRQRQPRAEPADVPWLPVQQRGFEFLMTQQEDGVFSVSAGGQRFPDVGLSGIGLAALQTKPPDKRTPQEAAVIAKGLDWLVAQQDDQGAIGDSYVNYSTCAAVMALSAAGEPRYDEALAKAQRFVLALQNVEERGYGRSDRDYGSIGYGGDERGDLSNLQFAVDALRRTGLDPQHEAFQKATVFLQRVQNLREVNDFSARTRSEEDGSWQDVKPGDDGGAAYYPGNSPAGYHELPDGTLVPRSYGSMTYALLKAYILCGLPPTDKRVQAAVSWIRQNWTLEVNPGADPKLGEKAAHQGLYYYYMVAAQALDLAGVDQLEVKAAGERGDDTARTVDWRQELRSHLERTQRPDGSWLNEVSGRWWEDQPLVCTVYALLALQRCTQP